MATFKNKPTRNQGLRLIVAGVLKHFPSGQIVLARRTFNMPDDLVNLIQADIDTTDKADKARADWLALVQAQNDSHDALAPTLRMLQAYVVSQFGDTQDAGSTLAEFGYTPRKVAELPVATKAGAADKGRATRTARHTMGKVQRKAVKGTVTPSAPEPTPAAPTPVVTATPAGTGGSVPPRAS